MKKVCDYEIDWSSGAFTCCMDHIMGCQDKAHIGMVIECDHCGKELTLTRCPDGEIRWVVS